VTRAEYEGFENEQVERALQEGDAIVGIILGRHPTQSMALSWVGCQQELRGGSLKMYARKKGLLRAMNSILTTTG
jgi:hypothetical protein